MATRTYDILLADGTRQSVTETIPIEEENETIIADKMAQARKSNLTYLASVTPATAAERLARLELQVERLTRQCNAIYMLQRHDTVSTEGT